MKQGKQEKPWRVCPDHTDDIMRTCQCNDVEMGLGCLHHILNPYIEALGFNPSPMANVCRYIAGMGMEQAYKTYPTEEALIEAWTRES